MRRRACMPIVLGLIACAAPAARAEDLLQAGFKRIRGTAIERLLAGKEFGDGVHWRYSSSRMVAPWSMPSASVRS